MTNIQEVCKLEANAKECMHIVQSNLLESYYQLVWSGFNDPDSVFTISDIGRLLEAAFFLPGNLIIYMTANVVALHDFLEISELSFNGWTAGILSTLAIPITLSTLREIINPS